MVEQDRGDEGIRWRLKDPGAVGSTEAWIEAIAADGCVMHTFVRVDPAAKAWPRWRAAVTERRVRRHMAVELWAFKDYVEECGLRADR